MTTKFKIGNKVRVKSIEWFSENAKVKCMMPECMKIHCGEVMNIHWVRENYYLVKENGFGWQDWMLEDEPVAEEKQEQLLKRNNMETKMTKKEAFDFLLGKKVLCLNQSETISVQKKLFEIGYMWPAEKQKPLVDCFAIFMKKELLTMTSDINYWIGVECEKIGVSEILSIEIIEEPIEKFDFSTFKHYDKVLVRNDNDSIWIPTFFSTYNNGFCSYKNRFIITDNISYKQCIPYNEETIHLAGTKQEAPKKYIQ